MSHIKGYSRRGDWIGGAAHSEKAGWVAGCCTYASCILPPPEEQVPGGVVMTRLPLVALFFPLPRERAVQLVSKKIIFEKPADLSGYDHLEVSRVGIEDMEERAFFLHKDVHSKIMFIQVIESIITRSSFFLIYLILWHLKEAKGISLKVFLHLKVVGRLGLRN